MELGMHPASLYPRRSRVAPKRRTTLDKLLVSPIVGCGLVAVKLLYSLELLTFTCLTCMYAGPHNVC